MTRNYYQWVPLVLGLQAILYYLPRIIWSIFTYNRTGMDLQNVIRSANSASKDEGEKREKTVRHLAKSLELMLFSRREYHNRGARTERMLALLPGKRHGNNLIYYYLGIKLLYVLVGCCQLYLMYVFLRFDNREGYFFFGIRILADITRGKPWTETQVFPRVGMCRHTLQHVAASNKLFAQCVLPINMLNEKIYVFLYFFLSSVLLMTIFSVPLWLVRIAARRQRHFVRRFLKMADVYNRDDEKMRDLINRFINEFLRQDGHFLLRMLSMNAGDLITVEIVCCLFGDYKKQYYGKDFRIGERKPKSNDYGELFVLKATGSQVSGYPHYHQNPPHLMPPSHSEGNMVSPDGDFMSLTLQPGGQVVTSKHRPLPSAPVLPDTKSARLPYPTDFTDYGADMPPPLYPNTNTEFQRPQKGAAVDGDGGKYVEGDEKEAARKTAIIHRQAADRDDETSNPPHPPNSTVRRTYNV
ncbi:unnamed protein product [Dibothriocephalus latus]|uniref:Innexin n=1 Tax=Dibothriocephalus latus TaxID=60516 RepID=A0A3P7P3T7_DIBLA|nr:unnamed protein product [Dibothriocephalus latus]